MAVVDFRSGGFQGTQNQRPTQDFPLGHDGPGGEEGWHDDDGWDAQQYAQGHDPAAYESLTLGQRLSRLTQYLGALISVGLIVILAVWGFKLVVRDVSGVPVIRAIQGEARTASENPGGELTDRVGLSVNTVAAGARPGEVDRVAIAPTATGLEDQDVPMGALGATAQQPSRAVELPVIDESARVIARPDSEPLAPAVEDSVENAVIVDAPAADAPVNEALTDLAGRETQDSAINDALAQAQSVAPDQPVVQPVVAQSARPAPRPRRVAAVQTASAPSVPVVNEARPETVSRPAETAAADEPAPAPARVASGSSMAQIGAFDSDKLARGEWNRVSGKFGGIFAGKSMVVQEHKANGRTFWRLRAGGFASKDETRRFCAALIAEGVDCIPATAK